MNKFEDLQKLEIAFWENLSGDSFFIGLDEKRPFGNSDYCNSILEIIGQDTNEEGYTEKQRNYALELFKDLVPYLKKKYLVQNENIPFPSRLVYP